MPTLEVKPLLRLESPYPGLRTFEPEESFLFFGREEQTRELLARLADHRLLAVVGTSGSGKSSLVRAGLVPALQRGFLAGATSRWKVAIMLEESLEADSAVIPIRHNPVVGVRG